MKPQHPNGVELFPLDLDPAGVGSDPCEHCQGWWVEHLEVDGRDVVREWHQGGCTWYLSWSEPLWSDDDLWDAFSERAGDRAGAELAHGLPTAGAGPPSADLLGDVMRRIDDADPFDVDDGAHVSVWEDPDRLTDRIWGALAVPMALALYLRYLRPARSDALSLVSSAGLTPGSRERLAVVVRGTGSGGAVAGRTSLEAHSAIHLEASPLLHPLHDLGVQSYASFPMVLRGVLIGTLAVGSVSRSAFTDHEVLVLRALTDCLVDAVDAAERHRGPRPSPA